MRRWSHRRSTPHWSAACRPTTAYTAEIAYQVVHSCRVRQASRTTSLSRASSACLRGRNCSAPVQARSLVIASGDRGGGHAGEGCLASLRRWYRPTLVLRVTGEPRHTLRRQLQVVANREVSGLAVMPVGDFSVPPDETVVPSGRAETSSNRRRFRYPESIANLDRRPRCSRAGRRRAVGRALTSRCSAPCGGTAVSPWSNGRPDCRSTVAPSEPSSTSADDSYAR